MILERHKKFMPAGSVARRCACGCGKILRPYNGQRPLVCRDVWKEIPSMVRSRIMIPGSTLSERRAAARYVFEEAIKIREARQAAQPFLPLSLDGRGQG